MKTMNTIELQNELLKMASDYCNKFHFEYLKAIVNVIIKYYLTTVGYYEENAIATMYHFLNTSELNFNL